MLPLSAWVCVLAEDLPGDVAGLIGSAGRELVAVEVMFERVAGLDVGKASITVCVRTPGPVPGRRRSQTRTFPTMTRSLGVMRDWLVAEGVTIAAIESTSTYWEPLYCLEEVMDVWLLNAQHMKAVPGRKREGCGVDRPAAGARAAAALVRAAPADSPAAAADPFTGISCQRIGPRPSCCHWRSAGRLSNLLVLG